MVARLLWTLAAALSLLGCATSGLPARHSRTAQINQLLPADAILLGEQHDAPDHQRIHREVVENLASQGRLAALVLEMAEQGNSTEKLGPQASEDSVRAALHWNTDSWPWRAYGPAVMTAVRAGVPVLGANLAAIQLREAMSNTALDRLLPGPALKTQQQQIRRGHCELLPEGQISPMTRIQIARDVAMAQTMLTATRPGKVVLLLAGSGHVDHSVGVPQHLPQAFKAKTVLLQAEKASSAINNSAHFDHYWDAKPAPVVDYCANFAKTRSPAPAATPVQAP